MELASTHFLAPYLQGAKISTKIASMRYTFTPQAGNLHRTKYRKQNVEPGDNE